MPPDSLSAQSDRNRDYYTPDDKHPLVSPRVANETHRCPGKPPVEAGPGIVVLDWASDEGDAE
jgi:hypothetical protein